MPCESCGGWSSRWATLSKAAAKKASSIARSMGATPEHPEWSARTQICARCPLSDTSTKTVTCGRPLLHQLTRRPEQGCGCPILPKAKDPTEHCPIDYAMVAATVNGACTCKWCEAGLGPAQAA